MKATNDPVVLFDGVCNLCHSAVQFICNRNPEANIRFASLQSDFGRERLIQAGLPPEIKTMVLLENDFTYVESTAALRVCRYLQFPWNLMRGFLWVPRVLRDSVYRWISRNRYRWFGEKEQCEMPSHCDPSRFI